MENPSFPSGASKLNPLQPVMEVLQGLDRDVVCARHGLSRDELDRRVRDYQESRRQMALADYLKLPKAGRNDPCPCGSGKKYKKCCQPKHDEARKNMPTDQLTAMEEQAKKKEKLEKDVAKGFDLLFSQDFDKARKHATRAQEAYPEDDRFHDIVAMSSLALGDFGEAFLICRRRWQVAQDEKAFFQEKGYHRREGANHENLVYFYSPSTWLEKFWIAQRARTYAEQYPATGDARLQKLADGLKAANDIDRFPARQEEGYEVRQEALSPILAELEAEGDAAIPYLLPLTYVFSWASLFVPDLLYARGTDESLLMLAELSMFRFPFFAQKCLVNLEKAGERAVPQIERVLKENAPFDELKVGLISVLGKVHTPESFRLLAGLTEHPSPYIVNWTAEALANHSNSEALVYLERAKERIGAHSKIAGAIEDLARSLKG